jgi:hypothetical protein
MNQATIASARPSRANRCTEDLSILHFKRFLEALSAPVATASATGMQSGAKFRVLHVKRPRAA